MGNHDAGLSGSPLEEADARLTGLGATLVPEPSRVTGRSSHGRLSRRVDTVALDIAHDTLDPYGPSY